MGEVVGADFSYYPPNVSKLAVLPLKGCLADSVVFWGKVLQDDVPLLIIRGALFEDEGIEMVAAPVPFIEKFIGVFI